MLPFPPIRYNISTGEYNGWNSSVNGNITKVTKTVLTNNIGAQATSATNPTVVQRNQAISSLDVSSYLGFGLNTSEQYRVQCVCVVCACVCVCVSVCVFLFFCWVSVSLILIEVATSLIPTAWLCVQTEPHSDAIQ